LLLKSLRPERSLIFPFTSNGSVGVAVLIPTKPSKVAVKTVAPIPTLMDFPAVKIPVTLSKINNEEVPNSLLLLKNIC
jgi:hypothetical protein